MDYQAAFNTVFGILLGLVVWLVKVIWDSSEESKDKIKDFYEKMHSDFVKRDDFKDSMSEVKTMLNKILDKLDLKQDK
jgi:hypothetical protein